MQLAQSITGPVAVIGDIHGQVDKLEVILGKLARTPDFQKRWIVFIGDLVDRGPDPKGAIDIVNQLLVEHPRTTAIAGNHELAMSASIGAVPVPPYSDWAKRWLDHYGAQSTFQSYGAQFGDLQDLASRMPEAHREYLAKLPWCVEHPEYFFVHAGLDSNQPFEMQRSILKQRDFTLNRPSWLCSKSLPFEDGPRDCHQTIVSGHVKVPQVEISRKRILVDTTGGEEGDLSCVLLPEMEVISSGRNPAPVKTGNAASRREPVAAGDSSKSKGGWFKLW
jgi:serine/threonine protein phosphatase 1